VLSYIPPPGRVGFATARREYSAILCGRAKAKPRQRD
jgi:hypothetical protein